VGDRTSEGPSESILTIKGSDSMQYIYSHYMGHCLFFLNIKLSNSNSACDSKIAKEIYLKQRCIEYVCHRGGLEMLIDSCYIKIIDYNKIYIIHHIFKNSISNL